MHAAASAAAGSTVFALIRTVLPALLGTLLALPAAAAVTVSAFSPRGTAKDVRQVAVRFSAPVVRFGDPRLADPFSVDCPAKGRGHWADERSWVYDFEHDLPAGLRCRFALKPDFKTLAGESLGGAQGFAFDTGGPAIRNSLPHDGDDAIDEEQAFLLVLDAPASDASVAAHAYCVVSGLAERIPLLVVGGEQRRTILAQRQQLGAEYFRILWKDGRQSVVQATNDGSEAHAIGNAENLVVVARCGRPLPPDTAVQLVWGPGVATASGLLTTAAQTLAFKTRPAFTASVSCERVNPKADCLPMTPIKLAFSAPIARALAARVGLHGSARDYQPRLADGAAVTDLSFEGPFPEQGSLKLELPPDLVDDAGRKLQNAARFPLEVRTAQAPPLAKFGADFGILELREGGILPLTLRNVEAQLAANRSTIPAAGIAGQARRIDVDAQIGDWLRRVKAATRSRGDWIGDGDAGKWVEDTGSESVFGAADQTEPFTVPKPEGPQALEVVGIPLQRAGFYVVEVKSPKLGAALLGDNRTRYVATAALVTNLAVHFEWGREASLVFVTTLDAARPVAEAAIRVSDSCTGQELWSGRTDRSGVARIAAGLPEPQEWASECSGSRHPLMVSARTGDDLSFTLSSWNRGIRPSDFQLPAAAQPAGAIGNSTAVAQEVLAHSVLDRALFRAGETVSMKHFLRAHSGTGITLAAPQPDMAVLRHQGSGQEVSLPLRWDGRGSAETRWEIPKDAKLGTYAISLTYAKPRGSENPIALPSGSFRVEQFRVPALRAIVQGPKEPLVNAAQATLDLFVSYLSGGAAADLAVKLRSQVQPKAVVFAGHPEYAGFHFAGDEVKPGIDSGSGNGAFIDDGQEADQGDQVGQGDDRQQPGTDRGSQGPSAGGPAQVVPLSLDGQGAARATVPIARAAVPQDLAVELEYQDANGETLTAATRLALWPAAIVLGIQPDGWVATKDDLRFKVLAVDLRGQPVAGQSVAVDGFERVTHSYRRRLVGGFYAYDNSVETRRIGALCAGRTDDHGLLDCRVKTEQSGQLVLQAATQDAKGNRALASSEIWVAGGDDWWFEAGASDRIDVLPEQPSYESGQTARFQVRMPFRSATALVSVEREGVIDSFVTELSGRDPVVEVPIKDSYAPNVYVSVLALRGRLGTWRTRLADLVHWLHLPLRVEGGSPSALLDLGKPAYRLGIGHIDVGWDPHRLDVKVTPSSDTFKVRELARVTIAVAPARGATLPDDAEVAIAAVDEGLLELAPNDSWKLLEAMMQPRALEVSTATAQMQVVGKRHYGRKSGAPGGGGGAGRGPARELFDTLLLWQARVPLDRSGRATIDVPLNDSLSSFRIVAVASAGPQLFGTGTAVIRTTQELQLVSGLPALVREGDHLDATVTLRNASARRVGASVSASFSISDPAQEGAPDITRLPAHLVQVDAGSAREVSWAIDVPQVGAAALQGAALDWQIAAQDTTGAGADHLEVGEPVIAAVPVRTEQGTLIQLDSAAALPIERPAGALAGRGGVQIDLRAHLADGLDGITGYMAAYPYACIEQRASVAIALDDAQQWAQVMSRLPGYLDRDGLARYFPSEALPGSDTLTAYLLSIAQEAGREIPDPSRARMLAALQRFVAGSLVRDSALATADLTVRKLAAIAALARHGSAEPALLSSLSIEPTLWPTAALLDWIDILQHLPGVPRRAQRQHEALQILRARMNVQGTTMGLSAEHDDALWWLMNSADENALRALLLVLPEPDWRADLPRIARGALGRQRHAHWDTTLANAWGVLAMKRFGKAFEGDAVTGITRAQLALQTASVDWSRPPAALQLAWPDQPATLELQHAGTGKPWALVQGRAAIPLQSANFTGYTVQRRLMPVEQKTPDHWTRGDVARVHLDLEAQADMTWVVVDDPIPAGASIQGTGLGGSSVLLARGERGSGSARPAYEERRFDSLRSYFALVPKGRWTVEYTVRFNSSGRFNLPATRVEAMYAPEMFGELPNPALEIEAP